MSFVLDSSVALTWCFEDEATQYADQVLDRFDTDTAIAPAIRPLEMANALRTAEPRGWLQSADSAHFVELLSALPVRVDGVPLERALGAVLEVARTYNLTSYDACYLELAMREGVPLATQDARLRAAAESAGLQILQ